MMLIAEPDNRQRFRIILVMCLNDWFTTDKAWLFFYSAISYGIVKHCQRFLFLRIFGYVAIGAINSRFLSSLGRVKSLLPFTHPLHIVFPPFAASFNCTCFARSSPIRTGYMLMKIFNRFFYFAGGAYLFFQFSAFLRAYRYAWLLRAGLWRLGFRQAVQGQLHVGFLAFHYRKR